jgi:hypothetical protein
VEVARGVQRVRFFVTPSGELRERAVSPTAMSPQAQVRPPVHYLSISTSILEQFWLRVVELRNLRETSEAFLCPLPARLVPAKCSGGRRTR